MKAKVGIDGCYVVDENGCWIWQMCTSKGYPMVKRGGVFLGAHRYAWILRNGPIPDDLTVDHLCFQPLCVNVDHLRLLTREENSRNQPRVLANVCRRGHELTDENTKWRTAPGGKRYRGCRTCAQAWDLANRDRRRTRPKTSLLSADRPTGPPRE